MAERGIIFKDDFVSTPGKSWFDMSYDFLFSSNFGEIVPTTCMECMAEDTIHAKSDSFTRLAPLVAPAFGKVNQFSYHFYVRNRDIWTHWDSFFTNADQKKSWQASMTSPFVAPVMPYIDVRKVLYGSALYNDFAGNLNDLFCVDATNISGNTADLTFTSYIQDLYYLVLWDDGNVLRSGIAKNIQTFKSWAYDAVIYAFIPNKNETDFDVKLSRSGYVSGIRYNPFSNGTLFDYLGIDCNDMFKNDNLTYWVLFGQFCQNDLGLDPIDCYGVDSDLFTPTDFSNYIEAFDFNAETFFSSHCIVGAVYYDNPNNFASLSTKARYNMKKTGVFSYGDYNIQKLYRTEETAKISSLPIRAYNFIYLEYFRDENYISVNSNVDFTRDGEDIVWTNDLQDIWEYLTIRMKAWEHDPYTTALPQAQRGPAVHFLPTFTNVVRGDSNVNVYSVDSVASVSVKDKSGGVAYANPASASGSTFSTHNVVADLSAATIENFRFANATQRYLEKVARSGSRYYEYMKAIFGADVKDAKLNRPIYLSGDKTPIQVSEVLQTSASQLIDDQPLGQMAGRAIAIGNDDYLEYVTPDNGFFIELSCIIPRVSYQQGIAPMFTRKLQLDYPIPEYAQLGEEQVKRSELYFVGDESDDETPFGYQSRYYQWKYQRDKCAGTFKDSLDHWTWTRKFSTPPVAGRKFLEVESDYRQFAVTAKNVEHVYCHMYHDIQVNRALPIFGVPSL